MADQQITDLPVATSAEDADLMLIRQSLTDKQITKEVLFDNTLQADQNLADVPNKAIARTQLDVPQISAVCLKANNLSDVPNKATARQNLDLEIGVDVQAYSAQLAAVSANNSTPGFVAQTGTDTQANRTLTQPAAGMTISNPTGAGGNPTFALANDLAALEALASAGFAVRTGSDAWAIRNFAVGSNKLSITNPAGTAGDPTYDIVEANLNMNNTGTTLGFPKGGTGNTTCIKGDLLVGSASNTLSKLSTNSSGGRLTYDPGQATNLIYANDDPFLRTHIAGVMPGHMRGIMATFTLAGGTRYYVPLILNHAQGAVQELQCYIQTGVSGTIAMGLYGSTYIGSVGGIAKTVPSGTSLASGTFSSSSNGVQGCSISSYGRLSPGIYFLAIEFSTTSVDIAGFKVNAGSISLDNENANNWNARYMYTQTHTYDGTMGTVGTLSNVNGTYDSSIIPALYVTGAGLL